MARLLVDRGRNKEASDVLRRLPAVRTANETLEAAILKKRARDDEGAHRLFAEALSANPDDPKLLHEFAQTKLHLARALNKNDIATKKRLHREAVELLRRAIQLSDQSVRTAWCWFDLARALEWLRDPKSEIEEAFLKARALLPDEQRFTRAHEEWKEKT